MTSPSLYWLRNDLRLADNAALTAAAAQGSVIFLYVLDDETPGDWRLGGASRWWLHHSLTSLSAKAPLKLRRGPADKVIAEVLNDTGAGSVHFTRDYAPWSGALERRVKAACEASGAACHRYGGFLLHEPEAIRNGSGEPYRVYTPFSKACFATGEPKPLKPVPAFTSFAAKLASDRLDDWDLRPTKPDWAKASQSSGHPAKKVPPHASRPSSPTVSSITPMSVTGRTAMSPPASHPTCASATSAPPSAGTRCAPHNSSRVASSTRQRRNS